MRTDSGVLPAAHQHTRRGVLPAAHQHTTSYRRGVLPAAHQDIWRPVPQRDHLVRVAANRNPKRPRQPKIGQLQRPGVGDKEVLRLQIPVQDAVLVAVRHPPTQLK